MLADTASVDATGSFVNLLINKPQIFEGQGADKWENTQVMW